MSFRAVRPLFRATANAVSRRAAPALRPAALSVRALSSTCRRLGSGETDANLSSALSAEHRFELENAGQVPEVPAFVEQFRTQGIWDIEDIPGSDDVTLTRKFGNETWVFGLYPLPTHSAPQTGLGSLSLTLARCKKALANATHGNRIKLTFQVSDLDATNFEPELAPSEGTTAAEEAAEPLGPTALTCSLLITKHAQPNALLVDLETSDEGFEITNVASYEKALAEQESAEGDWARRSRYMGPQFEHLDQAVQEAFGAYLAERGVDEALGELVDQSTLVNTADSFLADFILSYSEQKEQKDYVSWLEQVKGFVEK